MFTPSGFSGKILAEECQVHDLRQRIPEHHLLHCKPFVAWMLPVAGPGSPAVFSQLASVFWDAPRTDVLGNLLSGSGDSVKNSVRAHWPPRCSPAGPPERIPGAGTSATAPSR